MSAAPASVSPTAVTSAAASAYRLSFARVVRSEWLKLLSLRSTWWSLAITAALSVSISLMIASAVSSFDANTGGVIVIVMPMQFTMLVAGILGAIAITGEYSTGMIRSTFTAEPRRGAVLLAKAIVVAATMALTTAVAYIVAILLTTPMLGTKSMDWGNPEMSWIPLLCGILAMATFSLIGLGFGFLIRNGAGAIAATVGVLFVLPIVFSMFMIAGPDWQWLVDLGQYLPMSAAQHVTQPGGPEVASGIATLLAWPAVLLLGAWATLRRRDA